MNAGLELLTTVADIVGLVLLVFVVVSMIRRTRGREHRLIKLGAVLVGAGVLLYLGSVFTHLGVVAQIAETGASIGTVILYYGIWVFLKRIRIIPDDKQKESINSPQTRTTNGPF